MVNLEEVKLRYPIMRSLLIAFSLMLAFSSQNLMAQPGTWKTLAKITFTKEYDEFLGFKVDKPVFGSEVKALEGKEITIKGFIIPVDGYKSHTEFVFSAYPYNMCFFCGGAGPETVMEVYADEAVEYTAEPITIRGILKLNADDINRLMYTLENVRMAEI